MKSRVLNISFTLSAREPRLMRQVRLLQDSCAVTVMGRGNAPDGPVDFLQIAPPPTLDISPRIKRAVRAVIGHFDPRQLPDVFKTLTGMFEDIYWRNYNVQRSLALTQGMTYDLVIAHDIRVLPVALRIAGGAPVLFDAHEYAPRQYEEDWWWRITTGRMFEYLCRTYVPRVASMVTVADGIAAEYETKYGVKPIVIRNSPFFKKLYPSDVDANCIRLIHHGGAGPSRRLETFVEAMKLLDDRYRLDLMLVDTGPYVDNLRAMAAHDPRIRFVDPVPMDTICEAINSYDIGLFCIPPVSFNQENCLPNKVFEYVQARLAIASGPTKEVTRIMRQFDLGVVAESFSAQDFARAVSSMTPAHIVRHKNAAHSAAGKLCFEQEAESLMAEVTRLLVR